jgi:hypothetical protein
MDVIENTGVFEGHCGVQLRLIIILHHYEPFPHRLALVSLHSDDFHDFDYFEL